MTVWVLQCYMLRKNGAYLKKSTKSSHQVNDLLPQCMLILEKTICFARFKVSPGAKTMCFTRIQNRLLAKVRKVGVQKCAIGKPTFEK